MLYSVPRKNIIKQICSILKAYKNEVKYKIQPSTEKAKNKFSVNSSSLRQFLIFLLCSVSLT